MKSFLWKLLRRSLPYLCRYSIHIRSCQRLEYFQFQGAVDSMLLYVGTTPSVSPNRKQKQIPLAAVVEDGQDGHISGKLRNLPSQLQLENGVVLPIHHGMEYSWNHKLFAGIGACCADSETHVKVGVAILVGVQFVTGLVPHIGVFSDNSMARQWFMQCVFGLRGLCLINVVLILTSTHPDLGTDKVVSFLLVCCFCESFARILYQGVSDSCSNYLNFVKDVNAAAHFNYDNHGGDVEAAHSSIDFQHMDEDHKIMLR